MTKLSRNNIDL